MKARVRSFGRLVGGLAALLSVYAGASTSEAAVSGTLQGCVTTTEVRANPSTNAVGLLWTSRPGNTVPIRRVLLRLQIVGGSPANFYTLTNDSGCTELRGATRTIRVCPPLPAQLTVIWASPNMGLNTQQTTQPSRRFTITDGPLYFDLTTKVDITIPSQATTIAVTKAARRDSIPSV